MPAKKSASASSYAQATDVEKPAEGKPAKGTFLPSSKSWFTDLLLTSAVAIFLLVLLFVVGFAGVNYYNNQIANQNQAQNQKIDLGDTSKLFENTTDKERFDQFIASNEFAKAFLLLSGEYGRLPSEDKRQALIKIADYTKSIFPKEFELTDFTVPCRQESCGAALNYSAELRGIKDKILAQANIDKSLKDTLLQNIDNAAIASSSGNKVSEFNSLMNTFYTLRSHWQKTQEPEIKKLAQDLLYVLEKTDSNLYESVKQKNLTSL